MPTSRLVEAVAARGAALLRVRRLARAPIWLFRARLGLLFGGRLLMLEHVGRVSGRRRYVVLEVVARPARRRYVVASGFGTGAQWFRNVVAEPHVRVFVGSRGPAAATATRLSDEQAADALSAYAAGQPRTWRTLKPVFENTLDAEIDERATSLPLVALDLDAPRQRHRRGFTAGGRATRSSARDGPSSRTAG